MAELPDGWRRAAVSALADPVRTLIDPSTIDEEQVAHYSLPAFDVGAGPEIVAPAAIKSVKLEVPDGAVLVSRLNPHTPRVWMPDDDGGVHRRLASTEFAVLVPRAGVERSYLRYACSSPDFVEAMVGRRTGTTGSHQRVRPTDLLSIEVALPPERDQQAIGEVLGSLDAAAAALRRTMEALEDLADAMFVSRATIRRPLDAVCSIVMGASPPGSTYNHDGAGLPFYQGVRDFGFRSPAPRVWCSAPVRTAESWDSLIAVRAPVGRVNRAAVSCAIGRGIAAASSHDPTTLYYALRAADEAWAPFRAEGTVFAAISGPALRQVEVAWPPDEAAAEALERELTNLDALVAAAELQRSTLAELRDALLPELLSGRLRVPVADDLVAVT